MLQKEETCVGVKADASSGKVGSTTPMHEYKLAPLEANFWRNCQRMESGLAEEGCKPRGMNDYTEQEEDN